jgi:hypothetical protein
VTEFKNTFIYLIGFAGVGKRTVANEICAQTNCRLIDNHRINNVVFPFVHTNGETPLPSEIWEKTKSIRAIALETMVNLGNRNFSYVFTNNLYQDDLEDLEIYHSIETAAQDMQALFVPISFQCDAEENKNRISSHDRVTLYKATSPSLVDETANKKPLKPDHENTFEIDVTLLKPEETAQAIIKHVQGCLNPVR